jgi:hypothetical protein
MVPCNPARLAAGPSSPFRRSPWSAYRGKYSGTYEHRVTSGGVGRNLPQEAPQAFAKVIVDVAAN